MKTLKEDILFIGCGGAGTNIAYQFERNGYEAIMVNSSEQDLRAIRGAKKIRKLDGVNGCAGDRRLADNALADNAELIDEIAGMPQSIAIVCFSLAGGTGSGLAPALCEIIAQETGKTVCCVCVLPDHHEDLASYQNAVDCANELNDIDGLGALLFIDNNYGSHNAVNDEIYRVLNLFVSNNSSSDRGNVDEEEKRRLLSSSGSMVIQTLNKDGDPNRIGAIFKTKNVFCPIQSDHLCKFIAIMNYANRSINPDFIIEQVGRPKKTFIGYGAGTNIIAVSGLSLPIDHINELATIAKEIAEERAQARREAKKVQLLTIMTDEEDIENEKEKAPITKTSARDRLMARRKS